MKHFYLLIASLLFLLAWAAQAQNSATQMNYQGQLVDSGGMPIPTGNYTLTFGIWSADYPGGSLLWGPQTNANVPVIGGRFNVTLGPADAHGNQLAAIFAANLNAFLQIQIGANSPIVPRQQMLSAPYAMQAANAAQLAGFGWNALFENGGPNTGGTIPGAKITPNSITGTQIANGAVNTAQIANRAVNSAQIADGAVNTAQIASGAVTPTQLNLVSGNVAIGKPSASYPLDVQGTVNATAFQGNGGGLAGLGGPNVVGHMNLPAGGNPSAIFSATTSSGVAINALSSAFNFSVGASIHAQNTVSLGSDVWIARGSDGIYVGKGDGYIDGELDVHGDFHVDGAKFFKIDHPLDPANKYLYHSCVESSEMKNVYDGVVVLDNNGEATVLLPEWFEVLNKEFRYQLTAIGVPGPNLHVREKVSSNRFKISGGTAGMEVSWQVTGIRNDPRAKAHPMQVEQNKPESERGFYLAPEAYGQPKEKSIQSARHPQTTAPQE